MPVAEGYQVCCGRVESVGATTVEVTLEKQPLNAACASCGACGGDRRQPLTIVVPRPVQPMQAGQMVKVRRHQPNTALASLVVFGVPLTGMMLGLTAALRLLADLRPTLSAGLGAVAGLAAGVLLVWLLDRIYRTRYPSEIVGPASAESLSPDHQE